MGDICSSCFGVRHLLVLKRRGFPFLICYAIASGWAGTCNKHITETRNLSPKKVVHNNREYFAPQNRNVNNWFHSDGKVPLAICGELLITSPITLLHEASAKHRLLRFRPISLISGNVNYRQGVQMMTGMRKPIRFRIRQRHCNLPGQNRHRETYRYIDGNHSDISLVQGFKKLNGPQSQPASTNNTNPGVAWI